MKIARFVMSVGLGSALAASPAVAQVSVGVIAGANFAQLGDVDVNSAKETFENRSGFHLGAFLELGGTGFALRPGVIYLNAGSLFEGASFINQNNFNVSFMSFPVDFRARFGLVDLFAGPEFQVRLTSGPDPDFDNNLKSWVVNGGVGAGLRLGPLMPEVRYLFGLSGLTEQDFSIGGVTVATGNGQRSQTLRASVAFLF